MMTLLSVQKELDRLATRHSIKRETLTVLLTVTKRNYPTLLPGEWFQLIRRTINRHLQEVESIYEAMEAVFAIDAEERKAQRHTETRRKGNTLARVLPTTILAVTRQRAASRGMFRGAQVPRPAKGVVL